MIRLMVFIMKFPAIEERMQYKTGLITSIVYVYLKCIVVRIIIRVYKEESVLLSCTLVEGLFIRLKAFLLQNLPIMLFALPQFSAYYACFYAFQTCIILLHHHSPMHKFLLVNDKTSASCNVTTVRVTRKRYNSRIQSKQE